jgi:hypothetical protein
MQLSGQCGVGEPEAHLDRWCAVGLDTGEVVLFGFAKTHPVTGGLAWTVTSELLEMNRARNGAKTQSGRRYMLGRQFDAYDIGNEGEEARLAFELLVGLCYERADDLKEVDRTWLTALKAARHLGVAPPARRECDITKFMRSHIGAYLQLRRERGQE